MPRDFQGLVVTGSAASVAALDQATNDLLAWKGNTVRGLVKASQADPAFALGHATIAALNLLGGVRGDDAGVRLAIEKAEATIDGATEREHLHLEAAKAWAAGKLLRAAAIWEDALLDQPRDVLALRFALDTYFFLGHSQALRDAVARVLPAWSKEDGNYGFLLGQYAFGLEEAGNLAEAEATARRALELNAEDAWATHALVHVLDTGNRPDEGVDMLTQTETSWTKGYWIAVHNWWHKAVFLIELDRADEALSIFDERIRERLAQQVPLDLVDAAALLWRLELAGVDVGERWHEVAGFWSARVEDHVLAFNDLHIALSATGAGDREQLDTFSQSLDQHNHSSVGDTAYISRDVGRDLIQAIRVFGEGDYRQTVDLLLPIRFKFGQIGGSHAQRDILTQTLIAAALRSGNIRLARALLAERLGYRPTPRTRRLYGEVNAMISQASDV